MTRLLPGLLALTLGFTAAGMIGAYLEKVNEATRYEEMQRWSKPQADCKSGGGCCRPRLQADSSWEIECNNEEWPK